MLAEHYRPLRNLFPDEFQLADLVLHHLKLPTHLELLRAKNLAEYQATAAFLTQESPDEFDPEDEIKMKGKDPKEVMQSAELRLELIGNTNPFYNLQTLGISERQRVVQALKEVTLDYNDSFTHFGERFPKLRDIMWQVFRRTRFLESGMADYSMNPMHISKAVLEKCKYVRVAVSDDDFVKEYLLTCHHKISENSLGDLAKEPNYRLVEFDKNFMFGIGRYAFAKPNNDIFQTIWDLRQREAPGFSYSPV